jgi:hypothetical protein
MVPVSDERNNRDLSFFLMTRNSGATWTRSENIPNQQSQGEQPAVAQRRDDSLLAFARTSSRPLEQRGTSGEDVLRRAECWRICDLWLADLCVSRVGPGVALTRGDVAGGARPERDHTSHSSIKLLISRRELAPTRNIKVLAETCYM